MPAQVLIHPGLYNSGPQHWQSLWQAAHPEYIRVMQKDWETPVCADWIATLNQAVKSEDTVVVGHSAACAAIAHWARRYARKVRGALLVAPSDTEAPAYPTGPKGFAPMPLDKLPFRSIVVASTNDVFVTVERAELFARSWGSELVMIGAAGHINTDAGFGPWPQGEALLKKLTDSD